MVSEAINDPLGSPLILMDKDSNIVKRYRFDPFGNLEAQWGTEPNHYLFTGKEKDRSGFYYFGARYYNPRLGRFVTPDPEPRVPTGEYLKNPQLLSPYAYCINNPFRFIDPDGRIVRLQESLRENPEFMRTLYVVPFYSQLEKIRDYIIEIYPIRSEDYGRYRGLFYGLSGKIYYGYVGVHPDLIKMGKIAIQVILYKELLHATFHYEIKGTEWEERFSEPEWHAAEEVVGVKKVFKYIEKLKKRKIEVPKEIVEGLKSTMEYYEHLTTKEHIEAIEKEMEKYGL